MFFSAGMLVGGIVVASLQRSRDLTAERTIMAFRIENEALRTVLRRGGTNVDHIPPVPRVRVKRAIDIPLDRKWSA